VIVVSFQAKQMPLRYHGCKLEKVVVSNSLEFLQELVKGTAFFEARLSSRLSFSFFRSRSSLSLSVFFIFSFLIGNLPLERMRSSAELNRETILLSQENLAIHGSMDRRHWLDRVGLTDFPDARAIFFFFFSVAVLRVDPTLTCIGTFAWQILGYS